MKLIDGYIKIFLIIWLLSNIGCTSNDNSFEQPELVFQLRHIHDIKSLIFSKKSKRLISFDGYLIKLWNVDSGKLLQSINGNVRDILLSPKGNILAGRGYNNINLWDLNTGREIHSIKGSFLEILFSPNGKLLVGRNEKSVKVWDLSKFKEIHNITVPDSIRLSSIAFSSNKFIFYFNKKLLVCGVHETKGETRISVWDVISEKELYSFKYDFNLNLFPIISFNGRFIIVQRNDVDSLLINNLKNGEHKISLSGQFPPVFSSDCKKIVYQRNLDNEKILNLYDINSKKTYTLADTNFKYNSLVFSPNNKIIAYNSTDSIITLFDVSKRKIIKKLKGNIPNIKILTFNQRGSILAVGGKRGEIEFWDLKRGSKLQKINGVLNISSIYNRLLMSPDGNFLVFSLVRPGEEENLIDILNLSSGRFFPFPYLAKSPIIFSPDSKLLATESKGFSFWTRNSGSFTYKKIKFWEIINSKIDTTSLKYIGPKDHIFLCTNAFLP